MQSQSPAHKLVISAMLSAVAFVLMFFEFPIPILIPAFIKMDFSDLPALLGAFSLGPWAGVGISFMKNLLHLLVKGTSSAGVGELSNFLLGAVFSFIAGYLYHRKKPTDNREDTRRHGRRAAILGSILGAVGMGLVSIPVNYYITYPIYASLFGGMDKILAAYQVILPTVDSVTECLLIFNLPFTALKGLLDVVLCFLIYKPLSPLLHK